MQLEFKLVLTPAPGPETENIGRAEARSPFSDFSKRDLGVPSPWREWLFAGVARSLRKCDRDDNATRHSVLASADEGDLSLQFLRYA